MQIGFSYKEAMLVPMSLVFDILNLKGKKK